MHAARIVARVPGARPVESARLMAHVLSFNKRGRDGSGKCSVSPHAGRQVAGVLYRTDAPGLRHLDRVEGPGYRRNAVVVTGIRSGITYRAYCYVAKECAIDVNGVAYEWYRDMVVAGAASGGLPVAYVEWLRSFPARSDPNRRRHRQQMSSLAPDPARKRRAAGAPFPGAPHIGCMASMSRRLT